MPKKKKIVHDPHLDQFLYDLLYCSTREQRSKFPAEYQYIFSSSKSAEKFCNKSTLEEKEYVMSLLGVHWFKIYAVDHFTPKSIRDLLVNYKEFGQDSMIKASVQNNVYVYSDKQIVSLLALLASTEHHPSYIHELELKKVGYHIQQWAKKINTPLISLTSSLQKEFLTITRAVKNTQKAFAVCDSLFGVKQNDMMVLFYLYENKARFVSHEEIYDEFMGVMFKTKVSQAIRRLLHTRLIIANFIANKKEYMIAGMGVEKVNTFVQYVIKANNFK